MKVIVIDAIGLHAGFLGCYGNDWIATPTLDSLACEGVVFDNHFADHPLLSNALPSSARSGQLAVSSEAGPALDLFSRFQERGWRVNTVTPTLEKFELLVRMAVGKWDEKDALLWVDGPSLAPPWTLRGKVLGAYFDDDAETTPWPDPPRELPKEIALNDWNRLRDTYGGVVTFFDARLGEIIETIMEEDWGEETLVCVTARSGLALGEHGLVGDAAGPLHEERVHVPLILNLPEEGYSGLRIPALTQTVDLLPSLLDLLFDEKSTGPGQTFVPLLNKETEKGREFALASLGTEAYLRTEDWALSLSVRDDGLQSRLYRKPEDRWEVNDLRLKDLERAEDMERQVMQFLASRGRQPPE